MTPEYLQLIKPNVHTGTGEIGECLAKQEDVYGAKHGVYPTAIAAWNAIPSQYKHPNEEPPAGVAVLLWWKYLNAGHTASGLADGTILSAPYSTSPNAAYQQGGTTQAVLPNRAVLERIYSNNGTHPLTYLGWSEYLVNVRVVQPQGNIMTKEQAQELSLYIRLLAFESVDEANTHSADDVQHMLADPGYAGAIAKAVYAGEWQTPAYKADHYDTDVAAAKTNTSPANTMTLKPGTYLVQ